MSVRARFFDDYRLSRIDEEADRLSLQSEISCGVDVGTTGNSISSSKFMAQRSASADGTLQATSDDDDDDDYELPLPPPYMTIGLTKPKTVDSKALTMPSGGGGLADDELSMAAMRALDFMQAKYDSLGKVKVDKPMMSTHVTSPTINKDVSVSLAAACDHHSRSSTAGDSVNMVPPMTALHRDTWHRDVVNGNSVNTAPSGPEICFKMQTGSVGYDANCWAGASATLGRNDACSQRRDNPTASLRKSTSCNHCGTGNSVGNGAVSTAQVVKTSAIRSPTDPAGTGLVSVFRNQMSRCTNQQEQVTQEQHRRLLQTQQQQPQQQQQVVQSPTSSSSTSSTTPSGRQPFLLTAAELFQVDLFYRSSKTIVHVSTCGATLFSGTAARQPPHQGHRSSRVNNNSAAGPTASCPVYDWKPVASGIPVVLLDQRFQPGRLCVVLAERGTGFELWRQTIDRTDQYVVFSVNEEPVFHAVSCSPSTDGETQRGSGSGSGGGGAVHGRQMGLHFDNAAAANEYRRQLLKLAEHEQLRLSGGGRQGKKKIRKGGKRQVFSKADISQPCCFTHVTRLEKDGTSKATLLDRPSGSSKRK